MKRIRPEIGADTTDTNPPEKQSKINSITFHPLCVDFIEVVFQFLPPADLYYTTPFVCSHWRHLLPKLDKMLWKKLIPQQLISCITETNNTSYRELFLSCSGNLDHTELFNRKSLARIQTWQQHVAKEADLSTTTEEMLIEQQKWKPIKAVCTNFPTSNSLDEFLKFTIYIIDENNKDNTTSNSVSTCRIRTKFVAPTGVCSHWFTYQCSFHSTEVVQTQRTLHYNSTPPIQLLFSETSVRDIAEIQQSIGFGTIPTRLFIDELCDKIFAALLAADWGKFLYYACPTLQDFYGTVQQ